MIKCEYDKNTNTPKKVAKSVFRVAINMIDVNAELECFTMTAADRKKVDDQIEKIFARLHKILSE